MLTGGPPLLCSSGQQDLHPLCSLLSKVPAALQGLGTGIRASTLRVWDSAGERVALGHIPNQNGRWSLHAVNCAQEAPDAVLASLTPLTAQQRGQCLQPHPHSTVQSASVLLFSIMANDADLSHTARYVSSQFISVKKNTLNN